MAGDLIVPSTYMTAVISHCSSSPFSAAWSTILGHYAPKKLQVQLQGLFEESRSARLNLPELHGAMMKLSGKTLNAVLKSAKRSAIDAVNASQRTALSWAAQREDSLAVSRLLARGADPNKADLSGKTPLVWAAMVRRTQIVEDL